MELGTHAFFQWSRRWGKHQYKNRLFLGPQYLGSVNASDSCEDDTLGYCWAAAPLQPGADTVAFHRQHFLCAIASALLTAKSLPLVST